MEAFYFTGQGSYSDSFGWDNGINLEITSSILIDDILYDGVDYQYSYKEWYAIYDQSKGKIYPELTEHGGNRSCYGIVFASSISEAQEILDKWSMERFPKKEMQKD